MTTQSQQELELCRFIFHVYSSTEVTHSFFTGEDVKELLKIGLLLIVANLLTTVTDALIRVCCSRFWWRRRPYTRGKSMQAGIEDSYGDNTHKEAAKVLGARGGGGGEGDKAVELS